MVLCASGFASNFVLTWLALTGAAFVSLMVLSGGLFMQYYARPTFEQWTRKTNPKYPTAEMVRSEILQMLKGMATATLCPAGALFMADKGYSQAYCFGETEFSLPQAVGQFALIWVVADFFEFFYHWCGHYFTVMWQHHRPHHKFFNPSPFAVIADDFLDQLVRSSPLLWFPMLLPINVEMMFLQFAIFFYGYGTYLHWGFELDCLPETNAYVNTSYHHHLHHALSIKNKPYHCGFFFKIWDNLFGAVYANEEKPFPSARMDRLAGKRTRSAFEKIIKPDYAVLLQPGFWRDAFGKKKLSASAKTR